MSIENGGPAFPIPGKSYSYPEGRFEDDPYCGMTLRDYFAAKAMQAMCQRQDTARDIVLLTEKAYVVADAMLVARD